MLMFSYGSNMSKKRISDRIKSVTFISTAKLKEHKLKFHKISKDGSGKADVYYTGNKADIVYGVVYYINNQDKQKLDKIEGLGKGYKQKIIDVEFPDNTVESVITYYAININENLKPNKKYLNYVIEGAIENDFPEQYINELKTVLFI